MHSGLSRAKQAKITIFAILKSIVIVIVNSIFLQRPQKRSRGNQLIHRRLTKTESIGRGSKSRESGRQTVRRLRWMMLRVEMAREVRRREGIGIGFVKKQCFQF